MIKRLLTSAAIISAALSANADTFDMLTSFGSSGWGDSTYDAETKTITYVGNWTGKGWWLESADYSAFDEIVIETKGNAIGYSIVVEYVDANATSTNVSVNKEVDKASATLDPQYKNAVKQIYLQNHEIGTLTLTAAYLQNEAVVDPTAPVVLWEGEKAVDWWEKAVNLSTSDFIKAKVADGDKLIISYKAEPENGFKVIYVDSSWNDQPLPAMTKVEGYNEEYQTFNLPVDKNEYTLTLGEGDIAQLTNTANHDIKLCGDKVTLTKITLLHAEASAVEGICNDSEAPVEYYNLQGMKVSHPAEGGIYIRRQGNKVSKILVR